MELVAVPGAVPPHPDLWEPLSDHEEIAFVTGASEHLRELVVEGDPECYLGTRHHRLPQADLKDGVVVGIAESGGVVRLDEMHLSGKITLAHGFERLDLDRTVVLRVPL